MSVSFASLPVFTIKGVRGAFQACGLLGLAALSGCAYESIGPIEDHFQKFSAEMPVKNTITVCSAYGCRTKTRFKFTPDDVASLTTQMKPPKPALDTPEAELSRLASTLAWTEKRVGDAVGTSADRPGDDFAGNGDPTQMDCVDVATNMTSYLLVLQSNGLLRHHSVGNTFAKEDLRLGLDGWPHYAAIVIDRKTGQRHAVDGWKLASGVAPEIVDAKKWYVAEPLITLRGR